MGRVIVDVEVANYDDLVRVKDGVLSPEEVRRMVVKGVVDTGANHLVVPKQVAKDLGLPSAGSATVRYADGRSKVRPMVGSVRVKLLGRESTFDAMVEPDRDTLLIGAIVLEALDLLVDCSHQKLHPRDPERIISEIG